MNIFIEDIINGVNETIEKSSLDIGITFFNNLSQHHDSEIKLYTSDLKNYTAAFKWQGLNQWKIDCPEELHKFHRQRYATTEESLFFIEKLYEVGHLENQNGFIDVPVNHFSLDNMLAFREEDKMMLKGQDPNAKKASDLNSKQELAKKNTSLHKKTPPKSLQQIATKASQEINPSRVQSLAETITKKGLKPSGDSSLFSI